MNTYASLAVLFLVLVASLLGLGPTHSHYPPCLASWGDTWIRAFDGAEMVYVPAGPFLMGTTEVDRDAYIERCIQEGHGIEACWAWLGDESPQHTVTLDGYWIDKYEITNGQYRRCVEAGVCLLPLCWDDPNVNQPEQAVVCASWEDATAYASWVGGRLPTEAEWEKAARGTDGRAFPWGDAFDSTRVNYCDRNCILEWHDTLHSDGYAWTAPAESFEAGASPYGAVNMAGNVWEWVADWYSPDYYSRSPADNPPGPITADFRALRGGSFFNVDWSVRCAYRFRSYAVDRIGYYGIRVAFSP